jgi:hypothetical protein
MKPLTTLAVCLFPFALASVAEPAKESEEQQWHRIDERMRVERGITNFLQLTNYPLFRDIIVHPSFGIWWHEVPPPNITNRSGMVTVNAFIATYGWKMLEGFSLTEDRPFHFAKARPIRGLPWDEIRERELLALTHNDILYVVFSGWHHNPRTNRFPDRIQGFKSLGDHWYAWVHPEDWRRPGQPPLRQEYEGPRK